MCRVERALERAGADQFVFDQWCKCARSAFIERDLIAIPDLSLCGGTNKRMMIDPRCFIDHLNGMSSLAQSNHHAAQQLRRQLNDMQEIMSHSLHMMCGVHTTQCSMRDSIQRIENHLLGDRPQIEFPTPSCDVTKFTVSSKCITNISTELRINHRNPIIFTQHTISNVMRRPNVALLSSI